MKWFYRILLAAVLIAVALSFNRSAPRQHAENFVSMYGQRIEAGITSGDGIPENLGIESVTVWKGEHHMTEFLFSGGGIGSATSYYGCYYSPDDVPLPFQNAQVLLSRQSDDSWTWTGEGDNHGLTRKIRDRWYYFEAFF